MKDRLNYLPFILSIFIVNTAGFLLHYFELQAYIIILGFRFHPGLFLPFLFCFYSEFQSGLKKYFIPAKEKNLAGVLVIVLIPFIAVIAVSYLFLKLKIDDPEYFYEFGLSSIADFPVYWFWNLPQLAAFYIVINHYAGNKKVFLKAFLFIVSLFLFELIPIKLTGFSYMKIGSLLIYMILVSLVITRIRNMYWAALIIFAIPWINFLAFGSQSETIINILFARQYENWEGFFSLQKQYKDYLFPAHVLLTIIVLLIHTGFKSAKHLKAVSED
ncbi:MAG: hypothetical protein IPM56_04785 [Ignavibacteriales bacterium]|nr:MAG: hypothetical protein IPM56_04785 [Ignavibacteriales bacterium]